MIRHLLALAVSVPLLTGCLPAQSTAPAPGDPPPVVVDTPDPAPAPAPTVGGGIDEIVDGTLNGIKNLPGWPGWAGLIGLSIWNVVRARRAKGG